MPTSNRTRPELVTDKNGKLTTVHRLADPKSNKPSRLDTLGNRYVSTKTDGSQVQTLRLSVAETATLVRETLKDQFKDSYPSTKFSVRSSSYSGGASINISYVDGPPETEVMEVAEGYAGATFNGMIDLKEYKNSARTPDGTSVSYGADYVFTQRNLSPEAKSKAENELKGLLGVSSLDNNKLYQTPNAIYEMAEANNWRYRISSDAYPDELVALIATNASNVNK